MNGSARGSLMFDDIKSGFWQTRDKMEKLGFVCEKKINDFCIFDMTEYGSYCLDFRLDGRYDLHTWGGAKQDCDKYGMTMPQIGARARTSSSMRGLWRPDSSPRTEMHLESGLELKVSR